jgi:hypothetical protein
MDDLEVGNRLGRMYPGLDYPPNLVVSEQSVINELRRSPTLETKFKCLAEWIRENQIEVLVWDTINSMLAASDPNSEVGVSRFFDQLELLGLKGSLLVRHDSKPSKDTAARQQSTCPGQ